MNLNPLKKDDNTDALVKALEDANGGTTTAGAPPVTDQASGDAATPPATPGFDPAAATSDPIASPTDQPVLTLPDIVPADAVDGTAPVVADTPTTDTAAPTEMPADLISEPIPDNNLPSGLSSDAEAHADPSAAAPSGEVDEVKRSALEQLRPLIEKLDLEPADKFEKYLMMLRASDDPALIKPAFDAAQGITGEQEKAQALLDIINEINYITANQQQATS